MSKQLFKICGGYPVPSMRLVVICHCSRQSLFQHIESLLCWLQISKKSNICYLLIAVSLNISSHFHFYPIISFFYSPLLLMYIPKKKIERIVTNDCYRRICLISFFNCLLKSNKFMANNGHTWILCLNFSCERMDE